MRDGNLATHVGMLKIKVFLFRECDDASYFMSILKKIQTIETPKMVIISRSAHSTFRLDFNER
jgi:hypothetical protein